MDMILIISIAVGSMMAMGWLAYYIHCGKKIQALVIENAQLQKEYHDHKATKIVLEQKNQELIQLHSAMECLKISYEKDTQNLQSQLKQMEEMRIKLTQEFSVVARQALDSNNENFLHLAKKSLEVVQNNSANDIKKNYDKFCQIIDPVKSALEKVDSKITDLEKARIGAYSAISERVKEMHNAQQQVVKEAAKLSQSLRSPTVRGRWGEMQLRRVVEISGLHAHCDFIEQPTIRNEETITRPDMIIKLPSDKSIIIDAKVALSSYLQAIDTQDPDLHKSHMQNHAKQIRSHINTLGSKKYWQQYNSTEFVVLFLPGDIFFNTALEYDPTLIEEALKKNIIIATPSTLIALLHAVAYSWRQQNIAQNCKEIEALGRQMFNRICDMNNHFMKLGKSLDNVVTHYNGTIGTINSRLLPTAKKFQSLGASDGKGIELLATVDQNTRQMSITG